MPNWVLFDDPAGENLRPLTWVRPCSALRLGMETGVERWSRLAHPDPVRVLTRDLLGPLQPGRHTCATLPAPNSETIWVSDLLIPTVEVVEELRGLAPSNGAVSAAIPVARRGHSEKPLRSLSEVQAWVAAAPDQTTIGGGQVLRGLVDLLRLHEELLHADLPRWLASAPASQGPGDGWVYHEPDVWIGPGCRIDHGAVLDAREGPIVLGADTRVFPHTWVRGPFHAAERCLLLGGRIGGGSAFGPESRVRGEVESSVLLGYTNKAHDGFLGHSYLGEWVNLGALTTTSDLKNNYGAVHLEVAGRRLETGSRKVGSFLGDHVKTRIGCLLGTGTVVGIGANVFGADPVFGKWIADFSWGGSTGSERYAVERFLQTAEIVFGRRDVPWTPAVEDMLRAVYHDSTRHSATE